MEGTQSKTYAQHYTPYTHLSHVCLFLQLCWYSGCKYEVFDGNNCFFLARAGAPQCTLFAIVAEAVVIALEVWLVLCPVEEAMAKAQPFKALLHIHL